VVSVASVSGAQEMAGGWHEIVGSIKQTTGFGEVVSVRGMSGERVHGQDLDVRTLGPERWSVRRQFDSPRL
jgi:hypothetical protein